jgi:hypothetical protein
MKNTIGRRITRFLAGVAVGGMFLGTSLALTPATARADVGGCSWYQWAVAGDIGIAGNEYCLWNFYTDALMCCDTYAS